MDIKSLKRILESDLDTTREILNMITSEGMDELIIRYNERINVLNEVLSYIK